jgi:hypothetical protein
MLALLAVTAVGDMCIYLTPAIYPAPAVECAYGALSSEPAYAATARTPSGPSAARSSTAS